MFVYACLGDWCISAAHEPQWWLGGLWQHTAAQPLQRAAAASFHRFLGHLTLYTQCSGFAYYQLLQYGTWQ